MKKRITTQILSWLLVFGLVLSGAPLSQMPVYATEEAATPSGETFTDLGEIIAYEELASEIAVQSVPLGTDEYELNLPATLMAKVRLPLAKVSLPLEGASSVTGSAIDVPNQAEQNQELEDQNKELDEENNEIDEQKQEQNGKMQIGEEVIAVEPMIMDIPVPVRWTASPTYAGNTAGKYLFTATVEGYTVSAEPPVITVTIGTTVTGGLITAFTELPEEVRWQNTESPVFPETVEAMVEGNTVEIPVTWEADHNYDAEYPQRGLYVFTAVLGEAYSAAGGVELPRLTVYIPRAAGLMMARMAGSGSTDSPLEITTAAQLAEVATLVNEGRLESFLLNNAPDVKAGLKLMNDIDLSAYGQNYDSGDGWTPIGNGSNPFKGIFDGNGKVISGLYINRHADFQGLFGYVSGGTIENLGLTNIDIKGSKNAGGIAGYLGSGTVQNCYTTGSVGNTTVDGYRYLGGVAGLVASATVKNCYSTASVTATTSSNYTVRAGGVIGQTQGGTVVENCYSTGSVSGTVSEISVCVGGVVGYSGSGTTVKNCYSTGSVSGTKSNSESGITVGGVVGYLESSTSTVQNCVALNSSISGTAGDFGRMAGTNNGTLSNNYAFKDIAPGPWNTEKGQDKKNGTDVTQTDLSDSSFWTTSGNWNGSAWDDEAWNFETNQLPVLKGSDGQVLQGQDATIPPYISVGSYFDGSGSQSAPYLIKSAADLAKLAELVNAGISPYAEADKYYELRAILISQNIAAARAGYPSANIFLTVIIVKHSKVFLMATAMSLPVSPSIVMRMIRDCSAIFTVER